MNKHRITSGLLAAVFGLVSVTQAVGQQVCRPVLAFKNVQFSPMQPPTMERKWTATVSVDASRCATTAGRFTIGFVQLKESAPDIEFREQFTWQSPSTTVEVGFWADEAAEGYWLDSDAPCPCRN
jgi:hypothetical protein